MPKLAAQQRTLEALNASSADNKHVTRRMVNEVYAILQSIWDEWTNEFGYVERVGGSTGMLYMSMVWPTCPGANYDIKVRGQASVWWLTRFLQFNIPRKLTGERGPRYFPASQGGGAVGWLHEMLREYRAMATRGQDGDG